MKKLMDKTTNSCKLTNTIFENKNDVSNKKNYDNTMDYILQSL